jgi:hypothetical protein
MHFARIVLAVAWTGDSMKLPDRVLEPGERISEILFGLIMALTVTLVARQSGGRAYSSRRMRGGNRRLWPTARLLDPI